MKNLHKQQHQVETNTHHLVRIQTLKGRVVRVVRVGKGEKCEFELPQELKDDILALVAALFIQVVFYVFSLLRRRCSVFLAAF